MTEGVQSAENLFDGTPTTRLWNSELLIGQLIVTAQQQPHPQRQNNHNCSWVETK